MAQVLFLDAKWDLVTDYLFSFRVHYITQYGNLSKHAYHQLKGDEVVQPKVDNFLHGKSIVYISGSGHGVYDAFKGYQDTIIWHEATPLPRLKGVIVHLLSCQAARQLGKAMVDAGARAFWGYQENFRFLRKKSPPADRYTDTSAKPAIFMDCLIDIGILRGKTPSQIYQDVIDHVNKETSNLGPFDFNRAVLNHNLRHLVCPAVHWGDRNATL